MPGRVRVIVIQEWWGLTEHIKDVTDRFAREGFVALAPTSTADESERALTRYAVAFSDTIPETLRPDTLHVSMTSRTASHLCACGCGNEVVTPLAPDMWSLRFDGESVTLRPSVGSYTLPCQSHYLVTGSLPVASAVVMSTSPDVRRPSRV